MSTEVFTVDLDGSPLGVRLQLPQRENDNSPCGVVLFCRGLPNPNAEKEELFGQITETVVESGLAVASIEDGSAVSGRLAVESIDDAAAVLHGLTLRDELDLNRISVLGHSLGAIVAACLSRRSDQIARLCLLSPPSTDEIVGRLAKQTADEVATQLGSTSVPAGYFDALADLTPIQDISTHDRPTLIMHGAADRVAPSATALAYQHAIISANHEVELMLVAMGDHLFSNSSARVACLDQLGRFLGAGAEATTSRS